MNNMGIHLEATIQSKLLYAALVKRWVAAYDDNVRSSVLPGSFSLQVQTIDRCNGKCLMCPYAEKEKSESVNTMDDGLYTHILRQAQEAGTVRSFVIMLQNEPFLDKKLEERATEAKQIIGNTASINVVTNGSLLTTERMDEACRSGIDTVAVSIDALDSETYEKIHRGHSFDKVVDNVCSLLKRSRRPHVIARFLKQVDNIDQENEFRQLWKKRGAGVFVHQVVNRAGTLDDYLSIKSGSENLRNKVTRKLMKMVFPFCSMPFHTLSVLHDGRVILCCHDWGPAVIIGDLSRQSLKEVWNSEQINHYRHILLNKNAGESAPCSDCSLGVEY